MLGAFGWWSAGNLRGRFMEFAVSGCMGATRSTTMPSTVKLDDPLLRPDEAARLLAVKTNWIYEAVRARRLPCLRLGRHIRVHASHARAVAQREFRTLIAVLTRQFSTPRKGES